MPLVPPEPPREPAQPLELYALKIENRPSARLVPASRWRDWSNDTHDRFANRCLPLLVANQAGWVIENPLAFEARWNGGRTASATTIEFAEPGDPEERLVDSHFGYGIVTWAVPYLFRTPPGYNLLARGPANTPKDGIAPLEGLVETDWAVATFTMNWKITRADHPVTFGADEPFCMVVPQRRGELEAFAPELRDLADNADAKAGYERWSTGRDLMTAVKTYGMERGHVTAAQKAWEADYFRGHYPQGGPSPEHQTTLRLRPFERRI
jgi:hypothetical protein